MFQACLNENMRTPTNQIYAMYLDKLKRNDLAGLIAALVLSFLCLFAAVYHFQKLSPLLKEGEKADARVVDIYRGARNSKWAVYTFQTQSNKKITARDQFQMYIKRMNKGDQVRVFYLPSNPKIVTADLGIWIWQGTIIFIFGFIFLLIIGILILKYSSKQNQK